MPRGSSLCSYYLEKVYQKDSNIVSRKIADEYILVPIRQNVGDTDSIYTLNKVGARVWELINGETSIGEIKGIIVDEFEVDQKVAEKDLIEFFKELVDMGWVNKVSKEV